MKDELEELKRDAARYRFLRDLKCCMFSLSLNEGHAAKYTTVAEQMKCLPDVYDDISEETRRRMIETNTDWQLQVYPNTPIGFVLHVGATLDEVVDEAMNQSDNNPGKEVGRRAVPTGEARRLVDMTGHIGGAKAVPGGTEFTVRFPGGAELDVPVPAGFTRDEFIAAVSGFAKVRLVIELTEDE